jgi:hypothetical protein
MNHLKSNSLTFTAYLKSESFGKSIVDFRFDETYSNAENNHFAVLEKNQSNNSMGYSVYICKINFSSDPKKKEESIKKIYRVASEVYTVSPDSFLDTDFSAYYKIYYSSKENKVVLVGLNCNREKTEDNKDIFKFLIECKIVSKAPLPQNAQGGQMMQSAQSTSKSVWTSFNDKQTIDKILGTETSKTTNQRSMS